MINPKGYCYCTLFDSHYAAVGVVMIESFLKYNSTSKMYVLCMDEDVYDALLGRYYAFPGMQEFIKRAEEVSSIQDKEDESRIILIPLERFLTDELIELKNNRSWREFCWTCSAMIIKYVFEQFEETICTYVDADVAFYADPDDLVDEMVLKKKDVQIVEHRFKSDLSGRRQLKESGRFCVEFNTFRNNSMGNMVLNDWIKCIKISCSEDSNSPNGIGDQYYLNEWPQKYSCVHILQQVGAGIAPWNISRYHLANPKVEDDQKYIYVSFDKKGCWRAYFYHFTHLSFLNERIANLGVFHRYFFLDKKTVYAFYIPYLYSLYKVAESMGVHILDGKTIDKKERKRTVREYAYILICKLKELLNGNSDFVRIDDLGSKDK